MKKVYNSLPQIIKIEKYSEDLKVACNEFGLDPARVASSGISFLVLSLSLIFLLSIFISLKFLLLVPIAFILSLFLPEYPKIIYKRRISEDMEEIPYILSIFTANYSITQNLETSFRDVFSSFHENKIVQKMSNAFTKRYILGEEKMKIGKEFEEIKEFFDYVNLSFSMAEGKKGIVEKGFENLIQNFKRKKLENIGKSHTKILLMFTFGNLLPIILLSAFPLLSIFLKGLWKFFIPFLILVSSIIINLILISDLKYEVRIVGESLKSKKRIPKWVFIIPVILSSISGIYLLRFFGIYIKIKLIEILGLNVIPFSIVLAYFIGVLLREISLVKVEENMKKEHEKINAIVQGLKMYLQAGLSLEKALDKVLKEEEIKRNNISSKFLKWFIKKVLSMREKSRNVIISFCSTVLKINDILREYSEELLKKTQNLSVMMRYTVIFVLPLVSSIIIKASVMIFQSYKEAETLLNKTEIVGVIPTLGIELNEMDVSLINLMMFIYVISVGYLILDFSHYLSKGETPSKRISVARDLLITSIIYLVGNALVMML